MVKGGRLLQYSIFKAFGCSLLDTGTSKDCALGRIQTVISYTLYRFLENWKLDLIEQFHLYKYSNSILRAPLKILNVCCF